MLKSETTWNAMKELMEAYRDCIIPHPNEKDVRAALAEVNESKISRPVGIRNAFALADAPVPKHYKIHWCLEAKLSPRGAGIAWDMEVDTTDVDHGFLAELASLPRCPGGEKFWRPDSVQDYVSHIINGDLKFFPMGTKVAAAARAKDSPGNAIHVVLVDSNKTQLEGATKRVDVWEHNLHIEDEFCGTRLKTFQEEIEHRYLKAQPGIDETWVDPPLLKLPAHMKKAQAPRDEGTCLAFHSMRTFRPNVKPDPKPAAPAAKAKPKPKTDRKAAAPKSKSTSKGQVQDYQKRLEKEAAAKEAEDGTAMDTLE
eukprot:jgi/Tetstr1/443503/TSEL_031507.t1